RLALSGSRGRSIAQHCIQVMTYPVRLVLQRLVRHVAHAVQGALRVRIERGEQRVEVIRCWPGSRDQLEGLAQGVIGAEAADQDIGDLASRNYAIARIACLACIALQEDKPVLVRTVVIEPAGTHDRVRQSAGTNQPFRAPLPVVGLGGAVVRASAIGDSDGGHQRDARCPRTQRSKDVAHSAVIDALSPHLSGSVRAECEHDGVDTVHRLGKRIGAGDVTEDHLRFAGKLTSLVRGAHQGTHGMALPQRLLDDEAPDASGGANDQYSHSWIGHDISLLFGVAAPAVTSSTKAVFSCSTPRHFACRFFRWPRNRFTPILEKLYRWRSGTSHRT